MKKYDFFALHRAVEGKKHPPFLQDFCKNAQWRAKKLRERGSNTARPTEKGGGGLLIRSIRSISARRFGRFRRELRTSSWRFVLIRSCRSMLECCLCRDSVDSVDFGASIRSIRSCPVAIWRADCVGRVGRVEVKARRFGRVGRVEVKAQTQKKPDSSIGESGSAIARRRALLTFL